MSDNQQTIEIKDFQNGVADSPLFGHALMRNVDIEMFFGSMKVQKKVLPNIVSARSGRTFTADAGTDICTASGIIPTTGLYDNSITYNGAAVTFTTTGTLPAGLATSTTYFLIKVTDTTFKVATTWQNADAGTAINITDAGSGTHTIVPVTIGTIKWIIEDPYSDIYYALDSNGRVWFGLSLLALFNGNTITNASGNGMAIFRNSDGSARYLIVFRNNAVDIVNITLITTAAPTWTSAWKTMNTAAGTSNRHFALLAQDNIVYFTDDRYVGSIMENAGTIFDPANAATYTYNNQALTLPQGEYAYCLEELGVNLLIGGNRFNKIYPWNRSATSFSLPLSVPENKIYEMKNLGETVYIFAGGRGNIYTTQGTYVRPFKSLSGYVANASATLQANTVTWGGSAIRNGAILIGASVQTSGNSGVYIIYPDGRIAQDNTPYGGSGQVSAIFAENEFYKIGYSGNSDIVDDARYAAGTYAAVYQTELLRIGNKAQKATLSEIEIQLASAPGTAFIRVSYRRGLTGNFTTIETITTDSTNISYSIDEMGLIDIENIQFQFEFDGDVEIQEIRLHP